MTEELKFSLSKHAAVVVAERGIPMESTGDLDGEVGVWAVVVAERGIPMEWIERVLSRPMKTEDDEQDAELMHALARVPEHGDRVLRVVYNTAPLGRAA